jgi:hypothetical protein
MHCWAKVQGKNTIRTLIPKLVISFRYFMWNTNLASLGSSTWVDHRGWLLLAIMINIPEKPITMRMHDRWQESSRAAAKQFSPVCH